MSKPSSRRQLVVTVVVVLVVIAAGVFLLTRPKKAKYKTSVVARGDVSISVSATGTLNPVNQVNLHCFYYSCKRGEECIARQLRRVGNLPVQV